jgi:ubiquinone/menaquinone biosynthesis C-methylase UbiE
MPHRISRPGRAAVLLTAGWLLAAAACAPKAEKQETGQLTGAGYTAAEFDAIAQRVFGPIYPYLARQMVQDYGITSGVALDAGCGPAYWAIAQAQATSLKVWALDIDPEALAIADRNIAAAGLKGRVETLQGDIHKIPLPDDSVDLVFSRGSLPFWKDKVRAFGEIKRVLKPGGVAFIGGGLGSLMPVEERQRIKETMEREKIGAPKELETTFQQLAVILRQAGIPVFKLSHDDGCLCGGWVEFRKPASGPAGRP